MKTWTTAGSQVSHPQDGKYGPIPQVCDCKGSAGAMQGTLDNPVRFFDLVQQSTTFWETSFNASYAVLLLEAVT